jgi:FHA domain
MASSGKGPFDAAGDGGRARSTRIINPSGSDEQTKILDDRAAGERRRMDVPGTVIGSTSALQGARLGGQPGIAEGASDETRFMPGNLGAFDPVVGWLIVTKGPGKGQYRGVHYGQNAIGRDASQRVSLDFGDQRISRDAHAYIIYDESCRAFFIRDNGKSNVVRVRGEIVMAPTQLHDRDEIVIGDTTLMFVALCDSRFDWLASNEQHGA